MQELQQHLQQHNWTGLKATAHHLKSSFTGLNMHSLHEAVRRLEALVPNTEAEWAEAQQLVQLVYTETTQVVEQLRREYPD